MDDIKENQEQLGDVEGEMKELREDIASAPEQSEHEQLMARYDAMEAKTFEEGDEGGYEKELGDIKDKMGAASKVNRHGLVNDLREKNKDRMQLIAHQKQIAAELAGLRADAHALTAQLL